MERNLCGLRLFERGKVYLCLRLQGIVSLESPCPYKIFIIATKVQKLPRGKMFRILSLEAKANPLANGTGTFLF